MKVGTLVGLRTVPVLGKEKEVESYILIVTLKFGEQHLQKLNIK
jgi:hypothetical protein